MNELNDVSKLTTKLSFKDKNELIKKLQGECPVCMYNVANYEPKCFHRICNECASKIEKCGIGFNCCSNVIKAHSHQDIRKCIQNDDIQVVKWLHTLRRVFKISY